MWLLDFDRGVAQSVNRELTQLWKGPMTLSESRIYCCCFLARVNKSALHIWRCHTYVRVLRPLGVCRGRVDACTSINRYEVVHWPYLPTALIDNTRLYNPETSFTQGEASFSIRPADGRISHIGASIIPRGTETPSARKNSSKEPRRSNYSSPAIAMSKLGRRQTRHNAWR